MKPIAIFYHTVFFLGDAGKCLPMAFPIVGEQVALMKASGLIEAAQEFYVGVNGGAESDPALNAVLPAKAQRLYHGLDSRNENSTILALQRWVPGHPGWNVLYLHSKGATHPPGESYGETVSGPWRRTMMKHLVADWRRCVQDLEAGYESVGCHFMRGMADGSQNIWAGNFWWATSDYLRTVPDINLRDRIKTSGLKAVESRYEAEVWIGFAPRLPNVKEYLPQGGGGVP